MKYINFKINLIIIFAFLFSFAGPSHVWAGPRAVPVAPSFDFKSVLEGQNLTHDFIIKNQGDTPLKITGVQPP